MEIIRSAPVGKYTYSKRQICNEIQDLNFKIWQMILATYLITAMVARLSIFSFCQRIFKYVKNSWNLFNKEVN